jgi:hypothetical protein
MGPEITPEALTDQVRDMARRRGDYAGAATRMLEILLRPGQQRSPDALSRAVAAELPRLIAERYAIDPELRYCRPHHDEHVAWEARGSWEHDDWVGLVIDCLMLGAHLRTLPAPHRALLDYYLLMAQRQAACIEQAKEQSARLRTPAGPAPDGEAELRRRMDQDIAEIRALGLEANVTRETIEAIKQHYRELGLTVPEEDNP